MPAVENSQPFTLAKILYATDFSPVAEIAGLYAMRIARRFGATLEIAHVFQPDVFDESRDPSALRHASEDSRRSNLLRLQEKFSDAGIRTCSRLSTQCPVWEGLLLLEAEETPALFVLGTQSRSRLDRFLVGSTAEHMIRMAKTPILTVGPNVPAPEDGSAVLRNVLVTTDFSPASFRAAQYAAQLIQGVESHLHLLHIESGRTPQANGAAHSLESLSAELCSFVPETHLLQDSEVVSSDMNISEAIVRNADRIQADLIVIGARKSAFWLTRVERGVTANVLAQASCPVLTLC